MSKAPAFELRALAARVEVTPREQAEAQELGVLVNEALGIASYITDDGDPVLSVDAASTLFPPNTFYRSGHDGRGADPARFYCEALTDAPACHHVRSVAFEEAGARTAAALRAWAALEPSA